jgi:hypothetical protein
MNDILRMSEKGNVIRPANFSKVWQAWQAIIDYPTVASKSFDSVPRAEAKSGILDTGHVIDCREILMSSSGADRAKDIIEPYRPMRSRPSNLLNSFKYFVTTLKQTSLR